MPNSGRRDSGGLPAMLRLLKSVRRLKAMPIGREYWRTLVNAVDFAAEQLNEAVAVGVEVGAIGAVVPGLLMKKMMNREINKSLD